MDCRSKRTYIVLVSLAVVSLLVAILSPAAFTGTVNAIAGGGLVNLGLYPAYEQIAVVAQYDDLVGPDATAELFFREVGDVTWRGPIPMCIDNRDQITFYAGDDMTIDNPWARQARTVILGYDGHYLTPNTAYEVQVTLYDPPEPSSTLTGLVTTRDDNPPSNGRTIYVPDDYSTIQAAVDAAQAGDHIIVRPGTYPEEVTISKSGTPDNWITIESEVEHGAVIAGGRTLMRNFALYDAHYIRIKGFHLLEAAGNPVRGWDCSYVTIEGCRCEEGWWTGDDWGRGGIMFQDEAGDGRTHHITLDGNHISRFRDGDYRQTMGIFFWSTTYDFTGAEGGFVIRDNIVEGDFRDGISRSSNSYCHTSLMINSFIYGNTVRDISDDDAYEIEGPGINVAFFDNRSLDIHKMGIGLAPVSIGPLYVTRNIIYNTQDAMLKVGTTSHGYLFVYHNTMYNPGVGNGPSTYGDNTYTYNHTYRNNIIVSSRTALRYGGAAGEPNEGGPTHDLDYDCYQSGMETKKFRWGLDTGIGYCATFEEFQQKTAAAGMPQEQHGIYADPMWVDPNNLDFRLQTGSPCIDRGIVLPGFNDENSPWPYQGSAPDIGAFEGAPGPTQKTYTLTMAVVNGGGSIDPAEGDHEYAEGTIVNIAAISGSEWRFDSWTGDVADSDSATTTVTMDSDKTVTANWKPRYHLTLNVVPAGITSISGEGWYDQGTTVLTGTAPAIVRGNGGTRYVFSMWIVDNIERTGNPISITMDFTHILTASYKTQHYLTVESKYGDPQGSAWYDSGSIAEISVPSSVGTIIRHVFTEWSADGTETMPSATVLVDKPKTIVANWRTDYSRLYILVGVTVVLAGAASAMVVRRRKSA